MTQSSVGSPFVNPSAWDSVTVGGVPYGWAYQTQISALIGSYVKIQGATRKYKLEVKDPNGADGAVTTYRGVRVTPFHIIFYIYTDPQFTYFVNSVLPVLKFSGVKNAPNPQLVQSLLVYNPRLVLNDINAILVEEIGDIEPTEAGPSLHQCKVKVVEYLPPPDDNTTVTPNGATGSNQPTTPGLVPQSSNSKRATAVNQLIFKAGQAGNL